MTGGLGELGQRLGEHPVGLVLAGVLRVDELVHAVGLLRHDQVKARWTPLGSLPDRVEQAVGRRRLVRDDKDMGRL